MKKFLFIVCFSTLICCKQTEEEKGEVISRIRSSDAEWLGRNLTYFKDERTNLCFVSWAPGYNAGLIANVPCTTEVEKFAHSFKSCL